MEPSSCQIRSIEIDLHIPNHNNQTTQAGMAASQGSRYAARLAGAAFGGAIVVKALDQEPLEEEQEQQHQPSRRRRRRPGLLEYVRVEVKGSLPEELARPSWLPLPPPTAQAAAPAGGVYGEEGPEEAAPSSEQPPPLRPVVFVTGADACLIDNLVDDILQRGSSSSSGNGGGSRVRVGFLPDTSAEGGGRMRMRVLNAKGGGEGGREGGGTAAGAGDSGLLMRLWEGLGLLGRPSVEPPPPHQQQAGEEQEDSSLAEVEGLLSSISSSSSACNGDVVVLDVTTLTAARPGTVEGQAAGAMLRRLLRWARGAEGIIVTAASPLGLWKAQLLATGKGALPSPRDGGGGAGETDGRDAEEGEKEGCGLLEGLPVLHVQVRGMNEALLGLLLSESLAASSFRPALQDHADTGGRSTSAASDGAELAQLEEEEQLPPPQTHQDEDGALVQPASVDTTNEAELLSSLLRLAPRLDVLLDALPCSSSSTSYPGDATGAVEGEKARLLAALNNAGDDDQQETAAVPGVLLWDVLRALHGERLDVVTRTRLGLGRPGTLPLETLVHLCSEEPDLLGKMEALMGEGWLAVHDPGLDGDVGDHDEAAAASASGDAALPPAPEETAEAEEQSAPSPAAAAAASAPEVLCTAAFASLGSIGLPFSKSTLLTTPALATLAWRAVEGDSAVTARMDARSDARHVAQQAALLRQQRLALQAEWAQLHEGRQALAERQEELLPGDFAALQLELIRLERAAASRAYEMRTRARNLAELRERLEESLPPGQVPSAEVLAAPNVHVGGSLPPPLSVEERVLLDVDRGLRGVPVEWVGGQEERAAGEEEGKERGWWARVKRWGPWRVLPGAWRSKAKGEG